MTPQYFTIHRTRTNEKITVELKSALNSIKSYNDKQVFMNELGQDDFWKKNRLDLWRELSALKVSEPVKPSFTTNFVHTHIMLSSIKWSLINCYDDIYESRENIPTINYSARNDFNWSKKTHGHEKMSRTFRADINSMIVQHKDKLAFEQELAELFKKYAVTDSESVTAGKQYFNTHQLATRFVEMFYKI